MNRTKQLLQREMETGVKHFLNITRALCKTCMCVYIYTHQDRQNLLFLL